jgi:hypothetical protein
MKIEAFREMYELNEAFERIIEGVRRLEVPVPRTRSRYPRRGRRPCKSKPMSSSSISLNALPETTPLGVQIPERHSENV